MIAAMLMERLSAHLDTLKPLVDRYQRGEPSFPDDVLAWLEETEKLAASFRLPEGSEMSALRSRILKAADVNAGAEAGRSVVRRARNTAAADALDRAEQVLRGRVLEAEDRLRRFEEKICEGITAAVVGGYIPPRASDWTAWLAGVWRGLNECPSTRPLAIYLATSLSSQDRLFLLDRVLLRLLDSNLPTAAIGDQVPAA